MSHEGLRKRPLLVFDKEGSWHIRLDSLFVGPDNSLYCETKGHLARFKRAPFFELAKHIEEEYINDKEVGADTESRYCIKSGTTKHYIKFS